MLTSDMDLGHRSPLRTVEARSTAHVWNVERRSWVGRS